MIMCNNIGYRLFSDSQWRILTDSPDPLYGYGKTGRVDLLSLGESILGPIYTISKLKPPKTPINLNYGISIDINYKPIDTPLTEHCTVRKTVVIPESHSFNEYRTKINPCIQMLFGLDQFIQNILGKENEIDILGVTFHAPDGGEDTTITDLKEVKKTIKMMGAETNVESLFSFEKYNYIALYKNGRWDFVEEAPNKFEFLYVPIPEAESGYLLSRDQFEYLHYIDDLQISTNTHTTLEMNTVEDLLRCCMYLPQVISLESALMEHGFKFDITATYINGDYFNFSMNTSIMEKGMSCMNFFEHLTNPNVH